jgi:hypothetical protein
MKSSPISEGRILTPPLPCPAPHFLDRFFATILSGNRKTQPKMAWTQDFEQANTIRKNGTFGKV